MRELSIAKHSRFSELLGVHLLENFAGRGKGFDKDCLLVANGVTDAVQILKRQRQILSEGSLVIDDAEHRAPRTVRLQSAPAKVTRWAVAVSRTGNIDLANDALADPFL